MVKEIKLINSNLVALVDDEDYERINQYEWILKTEPRKNPPDKHYAFRTNKKHTQIINMHREVMNFPIGLEVDHIDNDGLNNQKGNLSVGTHRQNLQNLKCHRDGRLPGCTLDPKTGKYNIRVSLGDKRYNLGSRCVETTAHEIYSSWVARNIDPTIDRKKHKQIALESFL